MKNRFFGIMALILLCSQGAVVSAPVVAQSEAETALMRVLAKYSTVFRLVPLRISQMLQVITSYPATQVHARAELLQIVIQRMHEKYRTLQQLQSRVMELAEQADKSVRLGVHARSMRLLDALKKNQITLISTLSVLDAECIRALKSADLVKRDKDAFSDRAYIAAKEALKPNQMDTLITMLASGENGLAETSDGGSVRQELRKLRDEVSQLSAQLQAKSLLEGVAASEKPFEDKVRDLSSKQLVAVQDAQSALAGIEIAEPVIAWKKYSLRYLKTVPGLLVDAAALLQSRAQAFHAMICEKLGMAWHVIISGEWYIATKDTLVAVWDTMVALAHRICMDAGKAADHVVVRATEAKESMPYAASAASELICTCLTWIAESWMSLGHKVYVITCPVVAYVQEYARVIWCMIMEFLLRVTSGLQTFVQNRYVEIRGAVAGSDEVMREFACLVCVKFSSFLKSAYAAVSVAGHVMHQKVCEQWAVWFGSREIVQVNEAQKSEEAAVDQQPVRSIERVTQHVYTVLKKAGEYGVLGAAYIRTGLSRVAEVAQDLYNKAYASLVVVTAQETVA